MIEYKLTRSKRKTISLRVLKDATILVNAPIKTSKVYIDNFVMSKKDWIDKHIRAVENNIKEKSKFSLNIGDFVPLQGKLYEIKGINGNIIKFDEQYFYVPKYLENEDIKRAVIEIYKLAAKKIIIEKIITYSKLIDVTVSNVKINSAKTRWGSCSVKNSLNFSWRLAMAEDSSIDYVVVHELAHIKEHNHSNKFWDIVEGVLPDYKLSKESLKQLDQKLCTEDWD